MNKEFPRVAEHRETVRDMSRGQRLRRGVASAALAACTLGVLDNAVGQFELRLHPTQAHVSTTERSVSAELFPHTKTYVLGGLGVRIARDVHDALQPSLGQYSEVRYIEYSDTGIDFDEIAHKIIEDLRRGGDITQHGKTVYLYGLSMGGIVAYEVAQRLEAYSPNIRVPMIFMDSSPAGQSDTNGPFIQTMVKAVSGAQKLGVTGGPGSRLVMEAISRTNRKGVNNLEWDDVRETARIALPLSNSLLASQMSVIEYFPGKTAPNTLPRTRFVYLSAADAWRDDTVNTLSAVDNWRRIVMGTNPDVLAARPDRFTALAIPGGGHANPNEQPDGYNMIINRACAAQGLPSANDVRRHIGEQITRQINPRLT